MDEFPLAAPPTVAPQYIICWRGMDTGRIGRGVTRFDLAEAEAICARLNNSNPSFEHWPEPAAKERAHVEIAQG